MSSQYNQLCKDIILRNNKQTKSINEDSADYGAAIGKVVKGASKAAAYGYSWIKYSLFLKKFIAQCKQELINLSKKCDNQQTITFEFEVEMDRDISQLEQKIKEWLKVVEKFIWLKEAKTRKSELSVLASYLNSIWRECGSKSTPPFDTDVVDSSTENSAKADNTVATVEPEVVSTPSWTHGRKRSKIQNTQPRQSSTIGYNQPRQLK
jgi:hypothetical protein